MAAQSESDGSAYQGLIEERAEDLYENAPCGYISTLPNGTIVKVNQTFLTWTGYSREELLGGMKLQDLLSMGGKIFHETHYAPLLRMQGFVHEVSFDLLCKGRPPLPALFNSIQVRDRDGRPLLNRTTIFNVTERRRYEQELLLARRRAEQAAQAKAHFLSMVGHEIRTPMNAIIGITHLLEETRLTPQQQEYVRTLKFSAESLLSLINDILDFSKIEAGKVQLEERSFDLRQLVHSTVYSQSHKAEEKGLAVQVDIDPQLPAFLVGDPIKLGQVLTNLLGNAIKFTERGHIRVALQVGERAGGAVRVDFRVSDTGIGIAPDRLGAIFEEFTQASSDIGTKYGGTGLGLAICRRLLELYGSRMAVESVPGEGSSFSFSLRLKVGQEVQGGTDAAGGVADVRHLRGLRVLVVEDNAVNLYVLSRFLRRWGVRFDAVENGRLALERVSATDYDVVLMDLQMPEMDGYAATRAIRGLPGERFQRLPIIALSAYPRPGAPGGVAAEGFDDHIGKPFKPAELAAKLLQHAYRHPPAAGGAPAAVTAEEGEAAPQAGATPRGFDLGMFRELSGEDPQELAELCAVTIGVYEESKRELGAALRAGQREAFHAGVHKLKLTMDLMQAHSLRAAIHQAEALLAEATHAPADLEAANRAIQQELDALLAALREEVERAKERAPGDPRGTAR